MKLAKILLASLLVIPTASFGQSITVSGISSGAYMAQQFHTIYSSEVSGVGMIAGGPFWCAKGKSMNALYKCMAISLGEPKADESLQEAKRLEQAGLIDPVAHMKDSKVYVLAGTNDHTVLPEVGEIGVETYKKWGVKDSNIVFENKLPVGHAFPTEDFGNSCEAGAISPFISKCGRDIAGEMLKHLIGPMSERVAARANRIFSFNQKGNIAAEEFDRISLHQTGYAYIPEGCENPAAAGCPVHVAFHGCKQTVEDVKDIFYTKAGYNSWAEANRIVIVYPQIKTSAAAGNPNGCWDWWGYSGQNYHTKQGPQMKIIHELVKNIVNGHLTLTAKD